jgi:hypothetical protein
MQLLLSLPDEIVTHILSFLPDKIYASMTCKLFEKLLMQMFNNKMINDYNDPYYLNKYYTNQNILIINRFLHLITNHNSLNCIYFKLYDTKNEEEYEEENDEDEHNDEDEDNKNNDEEYQEGNKDEENKNNDEEYEEDNDNEGKEEDNDNEGEDEDDENYEENCDENENYGENTYMMFIIKLLQQYCVTNNVSNPKTIGCLIHTMIIYQHCGSLKMSPTLINTAFKHKSYDLLLILLSEQAIKRYWIESFYTRFGKETNIDNIINEITFLNTNHLFSFIEIYTLIHNEEWRDILLKKDVSCYLEKFIHKNIIKAHFS